MKNVVLVFKRKYQRNTSKDKKTKTKVPGNLVIVTVEPTVTHPLVEINIDYEKQILQPGIMIVKDLVPPKKAKKHNTEEMVQTSPQLRTPSCKI